MSSTTTTATVSTPPLFGLTKSQEVILSVILYSLCSGTLVLLNKLTLYHIPYPSLVVSFQLLVAVAFIYGCKITETLPVDDIQWKYVKPYLYYTIAFSLGVYCNMRSLNTSNVETVIVFRSISPCVVAVLDVLFLGREYPNTKSWTALFVIVLGAYGYACHDSKFQSQGYSAYTWPILYLFIISFEMAYGKRIIRSVDLKTLSGPVLYTNILGFFPFLVFAYMGGEYSKFYTNIMLGEGDKPITAVGIFFLIFGSVVGTGIGYSGWWCRDKVAATTFTLIGVMNKCLTVILNLLIWDQHAGAAGIASLALCLVGGSFYEQAPLRRDANEIDGGSAAVSSSPAKNITEDEIDDKDNKSVDSELEPLTNNSTGVSLRNKSSIV